MADWKWKLCAFFQGVFSPPRQIGSGLEALAPADPVIYRGILSSLVGREARRASLLLDWFGVAGHLPLSERVRLLVVEQAVCQGMTREQAQRLSLAALHQQTSGEK